MNNKLTRQKEAITRKEKGKSNMSKLEFVRDVWEEVDNQQQRELQMANCDLSEEFELIDDASYSDMYCIYTSNIEVHLEYTLLELQRKKYK